MDESCSVFSCLTLLSCEGVVRLMARTLSSRACFGALQGDKHRPFLFLSTEYESIKAAEFQAFIITHGPAAFPLLCQDCGD